MTPQVIDFIELFQRVSDNVYLCLVLIMIVYCIGIVYGYGEGGTLNPNPKNLYTTSEGAIIILERG